MEPTARIELPVSRDAPAQARHDLAWLRDDLEPPAFDAVVLVVSEALANATRRRSEVPEHERAVVTIEVTPEVVRGEIRDGRLGFDASPEEFLEGGIADSLYIIDHVTDAWGLEYRGGARMWFEVRRSGGKSSR